MRMRPGNSAAVWLALLPALLHGHEGGVKNLKPTKAQRDLKTARRSLNTAKKNLAAQGRYTCCVKPACDLCAVTQGSCMCAANVAKGLGACGECYAGWLGGRGAIRGVDAKRIPLYPAARQQAPGPDRLPPELEEARHALMNAKRTLVGERRFQCCVRGGCVQCAHEADCPCGSSLASGDPKARGVCGDCLDGWHSGQGAFDGVPLADVVLAPMAPMDPSMGPGGGAASGWYASGTSQVPRTTPMDMLQWRVRNWNLSLHGSMFALYTNQTGPRGRDKLFGESWFMPMASRRLGPGTLAIRSMFSLDPLTITNRRYPLLLQEGETAFGIPILNGQHPHDFVMELGLSYQLPLGDRTVLNLYGGPRGEPALGPPAFPHRLSSSENPMAVLSHHFQDSTHIATNVISAGLTHGPVTLEVSGFHGKEPDEMRWGIEGGAINSFATRLTITPTSRWTGQFSAGRINNREATHPVRDSFRLTSSVMYVRPLARGHWATSMVWGRNQDVEFTQPPSQFFPPVQRTFQPAAIPGIVRPQHISPFPLRVPGQTYNSYLAESTVRFKDKHWLWGRAENTDKDSLLLFEEAPFVLLAEEQRYTRVQAYTAGYEYELPRTVNWLGMGVGSQVTVFRPSAKLSPVYGEHPVGMQFFLRFRLSRPGQ